MDELERALAEYLEKNFSHGDSVAVRQLRDQVAARYISEALPLSVALAVVRRFVSGMVRRRMLERVGSGVYAYWPEGRTSLDDTVVFDRKVVGRELVPPPAFPFFRPNALSAFESVQALARSSQFLVQSDLADVNIEAMQGFSL
ncbi:hypothetical protein [Paracidovorax anthurii]|uniref:Uncharacterized protein n=1 Tax=Paracidovorax anthurii TaxID=78229 RepID=A0A328ZKP5_9BURK|nr:hypothetical protein [Paracidovorax anthurii]RAR86481.1 hypothetical protein AX018_100167 [Paracidovorax anthurii]